jgi:hypothetical protein
MTRPAPPSVSECSSSISFSTKQISHGKSVETGRELANVHLDGRRRRHRRRCRTIERSACHGQVPQMAPHVAARVGAHRHDQFTSRLARQVYDGRRVLALFY